MNTRERFHKVLNFESIDRLPMMEWANWWNETLGSWQKEGLKLPAPQNGLSAGDVLKQEMGLDLIPYIHVGVLSHDAPQPAYSGGPVISSMEEYQRMKPFFYPKNPFDSEKLHALAKQQKQGDIVFRLAIDGFFWGPRSLLGIEPHLFAFYDEPELMHTINQDIADYILYIFDQVCEYFVPDIFNFAEDMSYNNGPMLSEEMFDEFLLPYYQQVIPKIKARGSRVFIDSDGNITQSLPWFERAGIEGILPLERQAGVDLNELRKKHPTFLFLGHFDKMTMPKGEKAMRAEFERLLPIMKKGGFIPSVDHQTPPSVSMENYRIFLRLFREYAEKAAKR